MHLYVLGVVLALLLHCAKAASSDVATLGESDEASAAAMQKALGVEAADEAAAVMAWPLHQYHEELAEATKSLEHASRHTARGRNLGRRIEQTTRSLLEQTERGRLGESNVRTAHKVVKSTKYNTDKMIQTAWEKAGGKDLEKAMHQQIALEKTVQGQSRKEEDTSRHRIAMQVVGAAWKTVEHNKKEAMRSLQENVRVVDEDMIAKAHNQRQAQDLQLEDARSALAVDHHDLENMLKDHEAILPELSRVVQMSQRAIAESGSGSKHTDTMSAHVKTAKSIYDKLHTDMSQRELGESVNTQIFGLARQISGAQATARTQRMQQNTITEHARHVLKETLALVMAIKASTGHATASLGPGQESDLGETSDSSSAGESSFVHTMRSELAFMKQGFDKSAHKVIDAMTSKASQVAARVGRLSAKESVEILNDEVKHEKLQQLHDKYESITSVSLHRILKHAREMWEGAGGI